MSDEQQETPSVEFYLREEAAHREAGRYVDALMAHILAGMSAVVAAQAAVEKDAAAILEMPASTASEKAARAEQRMKYDLRREAIDRMRSTGPTLVDALENKDIVPADAKLILDAMYFAADRQVIDLAPLIAKAARQEAAGHYGRTAPRAPAVEREDAIDKIDAEHPNGTALENARHLLRSPHARLFGMDADEQSVKRAFNRRRQKRNKGA